MLVFAFQDEALQRYASEIDKDIQRTFPNHSYVSLLLLSENLVKKNNVCMHACVCVSASLRVCMMRMYMYYLHITEALMAI